MCHYCGAESKSTEDKNKQEEEGSFLKVNGGGTVWSCKFCRYKQEQESRKLDSWSSYTTPMISPTSTLSSSVSNISSCSENSVDADSCGRFNQQKNGVETNQEHSSSVLMKSDLDSGLQTVNGHHSLDTGIEANDNDSHTEHNVEIMEPTGSRDGGSDLENTSGSSNEEIEVPFSFGEEMWEPPAAEHPEDDIEDSVAYNDEDDDEEYGDGTKWGKPSSLCHFTDEGSGSYKFREEKQRIIKDWAYEKFKALVGKLLKSVGVSVAEEEGESWFDIVTSLSWEAASNLKPEETDGKGVGLDGYVKVKCIATGSRSQSKIFKGLVFKKHAAHKRMPTKYNNPKLLLIRGELGESTSVLSSFRTLEEGKEKVYMKSIREILDTCHPNVILVEKTVSRDVQECILKKEMTLVLDMKLHRLERVAQYTGSPILSSSALVAQKLKHCESVYFEKFIEEHAGLGEEGKKQSKTLMFIEGCPTRLGCTILLKGSHSDELKKVKCVTRCAVVMAYRLILETSFLLDQKAMFSTIGIVSVEGLSDALPTDQLHLSLPTSNTSVPNIEDSSRKSRTADLPFPNGVHVQKPQVLDLCDTDGMNAEGSSADMSCKLDIPISNGFREDHMSSNSGSESSSPVSGENSFLTSSSYEALSSYFGINGYTRKLDTASEASEAVNQCDMEMASGCNGEKSHDIKRSSSYPECTEDDCRLIEDAEPNKEMGDKDGVNTVLDSQSILVLMSSRNAIKGTVCKQSRFSHIMFYQHFDIPLGKYLHDNLLNQGGQCTSCGELPEFHFYYYAHHSKQLTIQVKRLPSGKRLPGEADKKIWMWSRCGKCKPNSGLSESTKRVLISNASRGLSFGKFLELSFSQRALASRVSSCGHSLQDFIYFFGLGPMAAMFRYFPVVTYTVTVPPLELEFGHSVKQEYLTKEIQNVYMNGEAVFMEVENSLNKIRPHFSGLNLNLGGSLKSFSDIEDMLKQERCEFEMNIQNTVNESENPDQDVYKLLSLNRLLWELLLESCIWDRRLHALLSPDSLVVNAEATSKTGDDQDRAEMVEAAEENGQRCTLLGRGDNDFSDHSGSKLETDPEVVGNDMPTEEIKTSAQESEEQPNEGVTSPSLDDYSKSRLSEARNNEEFAAPGNDSFGCNKFHVEQTPASDDFPDRTIEKIFRDHRDSDDSPVDNALKKGSSLHSLPSNPETITGWFWMPFDEIRQIDMKLFQKIYLPKFESISSYTSDSLPKLSQMISEEGSRVHIPLGVGNYIVSDYENELSSIIACALAFLKDTPITKEVLDEDSRRESGIAHNESFNSVARVPTIMLSHWSSTVSESDMSSISSEEIRFSSFDGLNLLDSLGHSESLHPEVSMGIAKAAGKSRKYSVICLYANQFRHIRSRCCPSELDYITSLSRCMNWDAKGGKSKSIFAKTLDERFVIKEIKKTEFESFMKFAPVYFKHINESYKSGNQTCLAKILGIYQVVIRQTKSGKEMRHDLMVMENLSFGRSISRQYDLKGALHARYNTAANALGEVLLDQNFVNDMNSSPLYISKTAKHILERAIWNDTTFLNSINVMDYSLLVGVDTQRRELVCGIIDYIRQYTWDKQLETWVKSSFSVPKNATPTIVSPIDYKKRFRKFISTYFLCVPDDWCSQRPSDPCELCGVVDEDSKSKFREHRGRKGSSS